MDFEKVVCRGSFSTNYLLAFLFHFCMPIWSEDMVFVCLIGFFWYMREPLSKLLSIIKNTKLDDTPKNGIPQLI